MASKTTAKTSSRSKNSSSSKPKPRSKAVKSSKSSQKDADRRVRANIGILLISAGILLGIYMLFSSADSQILGEVASIVPFGLFGMAAWAMPFLLIAAGFIMINGAKNERLAGSEWFVALGALAIIALVQATSGADYENISFMEYLKASWDNGIASRLGGGFVGGAICYPVQRLGGTVLAYVLFISLISICAVSISGFSLSGLSERIAERIAADPVREESEDDSWDDEYPYDNQRAQKHPLFNFSMKGSEPEPSQEYGSRVPKKRIPNNSDFPFELDPVSKPRKKNRAHDLFDNLEPITDTPMGTSNRKNDFPAVAEPDFSSKKRKAKVAAQPAVSDVGLNTDLADMHSGFRTEKQSFTSTVPMNEAPAHAPSPLPSTSTSKEASSRTKKPASKPSSSTVEEEIAAKASSESLDEYTAPSFELLEPSPDSFSGAGESPNEKARLLLETLENFNIECKITDISVGPTLTRFELQPAPGIRVSRITSLSNDIALALAAQRVRIEAPIPGKSAVGIEIPNKNTVTVVLRDIVESREFQSAKSAITMALGKDISGKIVTADLSKMPHMLIAGQTGSGKSVCINDIIISLVYKSSPQDVKMILIDPKMVELSVFAPLPHLLIPVVTEPKKAAGALRWAVNEMTMRYKKFSEIGARDLARYNSLMEDPSKRFPKLVVIIDELADLMLVAPDDVEDSICRIAQLGRASGIHLIVATQRPSADIITGLIKANIPSRAAFAVSSSIDSRIILDMTGAEKLLGRGDMLFHPNGASKPTRLQAAYVSDEEVERIVRYFAETKKEPVYDESVVADLERAVNGGPSGGVFGEGKQEDDLLGEAVRVVLENGQASISMVQRRLRVGYARAARLIDIMEQKGYVSGFEGSKPRRVLIKKAEFEQIFGDSGFSDSDSDQASQESPEADSPYPEE